MSKTKTTMHEVDRNEKPGATVRERRLAHAKREKQLRGGIGDSKPFDMLFKPGEATLAEKFSDIHGVPQADQVVSTAKEESVVLPAPAAAQVAAQVTSELPVATVKPQQSGRDELISRAKEQARAAVTAAVRHRVEIVGWVVILGIPVLMTVCWLMAMLSWTAYIVSVAIATNSIVMVGKIVHSAFTDVAMKAVRMQVWIKTALFIGFVLAVIGALTVGGLTFNVLMGSTAVLWFGSYLFGQKTTATTSFTMPA